MCTVVCRWHPDDQVPVQVLALRDELHSRSFDLPSEWWLDQPGVVGGRDRRAGGTWCATDVRGGVTAVVLNRPERLVAEPGAASRGILPLLALKHGTRWLQHVDVGPMAGFNLVLAGPEALRWWSYDGNSLHAFVLEPGTHMITPTGHSDGPLDERLAQGSLTYLDAPSTEQAWPAWLDVVRSSRPAAERTGLLVRRPIDGDSYETVFGQLIASAPGSLRLDHLVEVARNPIGSWATVFWKA